MTQGEPRLWTLRNKVWSISLPDGQAELTVAGFITAEDVNDIEETLLLAVKSLRRYVEKMLKVAEAQSAGDAKQSQP